MSEPVEPITEGSAAPYEGTCLFCHRDIGAGHETDCPYYVPPVRTANLPPFFVWVKDRDTWSWD